jgi:hypothetical protein
MRRLNQTLRPEKGGLWPVLFSPRNQTPRRRSPAGLHESSLMVTQFTRRSAQAGYIPMRAFAAFRTGNNRRHAEERTMSTLKTNNAIAIGLAAAIAVSATSAVWGGQGQSV